MKDQLKIAVAQMTSVDDWNENIKSCLELASKAVNSSSVDAIFFPENSLYMRLNKSENIPSIELGDQRFDAISEFAKKNDCYMFLGSLPLKVQGKVYNSNVVITPGGERLAPYQKIHLFDIHLEGEEPVSESAIFTHGEKPSVIEIFGWKVGLSICYDLRFSELYSHYHHLGVDIIAVPSAFLVPTGKVHWNVLLRARAIEAQAYVIAAAQSGSHKGLRETFGHSLVVDPWGDVLCDMNNGQGVSVITLSKSKIKQVRQQIPMANHRRLRREPL